MASERFPLHKSVLGTHAEEIDESDFAAPESDPEPRLARKILRSIATRTGFARSKSGFRRNFTPEAAARVTLLATLDAVTQKALDDDNTLNMDGTVFFKKQSNDAFRTRHFISVYDDGRGYTIQRYDNMQDTLIDDKPIGEFTILKLDHGNTDFRAIPSVDKESEAQTVRDLAADLLND